MQLLCNTMNPIIEEEMLSEDNEQQLNFERIPQNKDEMIAKGYHVAPDYEYEKVLIEDSFKDIN